MTVISDGADEVRTSLSFKAQKGFLFRLSWGCGSKHARIRSLLLKELELTPESSQHFAPVLPLSSNLSAGLWQLFDFVRISDKIILTRFKSRLEAKSGNLYRYRTERHSRNTKPFIEHRRASFGGDFNEAFMAEDNSRRYSRSPPFSSPICG